MLAVIVVAVVFVMPKSDNKEGQTKNIAMVDASDYCSVGLKEDGTAVAAGHNDWGRCDVSDWEDIVDIAAGANHTIGLKKDGTVVTTGLGRDGQCDVSDWDLF